jgi:hypothetical protein
MKNKIMIQVLRLFCSLIVTIEEKPFLFPVCWLCVKLSVFVDILCILSFCVIICGLDLCLSVLLSFTISFPFRMSSVASVETPSFFYILLRFLAVVDRFLKLV